MAGNANFDDILTTTLREFGPDIADNVTRNNALLNRLSEKGNIRMFDGGVQIDEQIAFDNNYTFNFYSGYETLSVSPSQQFTVAQYDIKQASAQVVISGLEMLQNSNSRSRVKDLMKLRIQYASKTLQNGISASLYSDGSGYGGKEIGGLQYLIADTPTNSVGGIDRSLAANAFWKNKSYDATTDFLAAMSASNAIDYFTRVYVSITRGTDQPDLIVADNEYWRIYHSSLTAIQRITNENSNMAKSGFQTLKFMTADVVLDGGFQGATGLPSNLPIGGAPTNHAYFLNTDYLFLRPHKDRNFVPLEGDRVPVNQDALVRVVAWAGNLTTSGPQFCAVLKD